MEPERWQQIDKLLERIIRRKNEFTYWNNFSRDFNLHEVSQAGHLRGMAAKKSNRLGLRIKPYISGRINTQGAAQRNTVFLGDVGLEDLKYSITSGLTLDATLNTYRERHTHTLK